MSTAFWSYQCRVHVTLGEVPVFEEGSFVTPPPRRPLALQVELPDGGVFSLNGLLESYAAPNPYSFGWRDRGTDLAEVAAHEARLSRRVAELEAENVKLREELRVLDKDRGVVGGAKGGRTSWVCATCGKEVPPGHAHLCQKAPPASRPADLPGDWLEPANPACKKLDLKVKIPPELLLYAPSLFNPRVDPPAPGCGCAMCEMQRSKGIPDYTGPDDPRLTVNQKPIANHDVAPAAPTKRVAFEKAAADACADNLSDGGDADAPLIVVDQSVS